MLLAGMYGGYFGAAQGVLMMGLMSVLTTEPLQSLNGIKNVLGTIVNAVAAVTFMVVAWDKIEWPVAGLLAVGRHGRRLPRRAGRPPPLPAGAARHDRADRRRRDLQDGLLQLSAAEPGRLSTSVLSTHCDTAPVSGRAARSPSCTVASSACMNRSAPITR